MKFIIIKINKDKFVYKLLNSVVPTYSIPIYFVNLYLSTNQCCTYLQYLHLFCQSVPQHQSVLYLPTVSPSILSICTSAPISVVPTYSISIYFVNLYLSTNQNCTYLQYLHLFCQSVPQHQSELYLPTVSPSILSICTSAPISVVPTYSISIYFVNLYLSTNQCCTYLQYLHLFCQSVPQHQSVLYLPTVSPSIWSICTSAPISVVPTYSISIYFVNLYLSTNQNCTYLQYLHLFCQSVPQHQSVQTT